MCHIQAEYCMANTRPSREKKISAPHPATWPASAASNITDIGCSISLDPRVRKTVKIWKQRPPPPLGPWWILGLWKKSSRSQSCLLLHHNLASLDWYRCFLFSLMYHDLFCQIVYFFNIEFSVTHTKMLAPWGQGVLLFLFTNIFLMPRTLLNSINSEWMYEQSYLIYTHEW